MAVVPKGTDQRVVPLAWTEFTVVPAFRLPTKKAFPVESTTGLVSASWVVRVPVFQSSVAAAPELGTPVPVKARRFYHRA